MAQPRMSVAMCTYNGARHLREQLDSIRAQTLAPDEVVLCDDTSTDNTVQIAQAFAATAPFLIRIFQNPSTLGSTANFDKAIRLCRGDIIVLADQDDVWRETKLHKLASVFLADTKAEYVFSDGDVIDDQGRQLGCSMWESLGFSPSTLPDRFKENELLCLLKQNVVTGAAMAFRSSLAQLVQPIPPAWLHDHWIALIGSVFGSGTPLRDRLIMYRQHVGQQKGVRKSSMSERYRKSIASNRSDWAQGIERLKELENRVSRLRSRASDRGQSIQAIRDKADHLSVRSVARSATGLTKVKAIMSEACAGRYHRFSQSWVSIARDFLP